MNADRRSLPLRTTIFPDTRALTATPGPATWGELVELVESPATHASKAACPLIKLAAFGDQRSAIGCLRHDDNVVAVYGVEGDYDEGALTTSQLAAKLREADVQALVVTTPSHNQPGKGSRARVFAPLSAPCEPAERSRYVGVLNGILGGVLAPESFRLSQTYYFGRAEGVEYEAIPVDGANCVDELALIVEPIGVPARPLADDDNVMPRDPVDVTPEQLKEALGFIDADVPEPKWRGVIAGLHDYFAGSAQGLRIATEWSATGREKFQGADDVRRKWDRLQAGLPDGITARYILKLAKAAGWINPASRAKADDSDAGVPDARHLTTDLANARRIQTHFGDRLMFAAGRAFVYVGTHWQQDDGRAYRRACALSRLILDEAAEWDAKTATTEDEKKLNAVIAEALRKWRAGQK